MVAGEYGVWNKLSGWTGEDKPSGRESTEVRGEDWNGGKGERRVDNGDIEDLELMGTGKRLDGG